jgi:hypothetical protein
MSFVGVGDISLLLLLVGMFELNSVSIVGVNE